MDKPRIYFYPNEQTEKDSVNSVSVINKELVEFVVLSDGTAVGKSDYESVYLCKKMHDGKWVLHSETEPALTNKTSGAHYFFYDGINVTIEDLPIDNEMKLILKLKYHVTSEFQADYESGFVWYDA